MTLIQSMEHMKEIRAQADDLMAQSMALKAIYDDEEAKLKLLDHSKSYYAVESDGTASVLFFDPQGNVNFGSMLPMPDEAPVPEAPAPEAAPENVVPLATT